MRGGGSRSSLRAASSASMRLSRLVAGRPMARAVSATASALMPFSAPGTGTAIMRRASPVKLPKNPSQSLLASMPTISTSGRETRSSRSASAAAMARLQRLAQGRLVDLAPAGSELWLDGGHNPDGGRAIAAALADLEERVSRPLVLIVGMLASKDCEGFLSNFTGLARRLIAVPVPGSDNGLPAETVAAAARTI